jgi:NAD(P)-dependent dehydrogenase (short-subunit alcohol dehydrogenase family)
MDIDSGNVEALVEEIEQQGGKALNAAADFTRKKDVERAVNLCVDTFGSIDVLINFAGITQNKPFEKITPEEWDRMLEINLKGTFLTSQAAYNYMMEDCGSVIINISSAAIHGGGGHIGTAHYTASKAGIVGLTKAIAKEGAKYGIRANVICPGLTETRMTAEFLSRERENSTKGILLGRVGTPADVVQAAMFLASEEASYITGVTLDVNGGLVMR